MTDLNSPSKYLFFIEVFFFQLEETSTISDVKKGVYRLKKLLYPERQSIRLEPRGKTLKDSDTLKSLGMKFSLISNDKEELDKS